MTDPNDEVATMSAERQYRRPRHLLLRLVQLSPLIALALLAAVWLAVPGSLSADILGMSARLEAHPEYVEEARDAAIEFHFDNEFLESLGVSGRSDTSLYSVAQETWDSLALAQEGFIESATIVPFGMDREDDVYAHIAEWERRYGTDVWIFALPSPDLPPLSAAAIPEATEPIIESLHEGTLDWQELRDVDPASITAEQLAERLWSWQDIWRDDPLPPLSTSAVYGGGGWGTNNVTVGEHGVSVGGRFYRYYLIGEHDSGIEQDPWRFIDSLPARLTGADPADPSFAQVVAEVAEEESIAILALGPIEYTSIPLRAPEATALADAQALGQMLWPEYLLASRPEGDPEPYAYQSPVIELDEAAASVAGGGDGLAFSIGMFEGFFDLRERTGPGPGQHPTPTMMFFVAWDDQALAAAAPTASATRSVQIWVAGNLPWLLGAAVTLLAITLIASPLAFAYEHRLATRAVALEEMARMRRDTHDRVYNRLSALSKQLETSAGDIGDAATDRLAGVAEEIRGTVGELQHILGEEGPHRSALLATQPLSLQLRQICSAQEALLGVQVGFAADGTAEALEVPAELGWDLQCVVEEAITNAVRHGAARTVTVALAAEAEDTGGTQTLTLTVSDDGGGSAVVSAADAEPGSTGLRGMLARAERWGGSVRFEPAETGSVLTVRVTLPPA